MEVIGSLSEKPQKPPKRKKGSKGSVKTLGDLHFKVVDFLHDPANPTINGYFTKIEEAAPFVKREYVVYALLGLIAIYLIIGSAAQFVCNLIGMGYAAYASVKAIRTTEKDDDTQWLVYWAVFACFSLIDFFAVQIMCYFPFYWLVKVLFLLYLALPWTYGAEKLYVYVVEPGTLMLENWYIGKHKKGEKAD